MLNYEFDVEFTFDEAVFSRFLMFFIIGTFFVESLFVKKTIVEHSKAVRYLVGKIVAYLIAGIFAAGITFFISIEDEVQLWGFRGEYLNEMTGRFAVGYVFLLLVAGVYLIYRKNIVCLTGYSFETYVLKVFTNFCKTFVIYIILSIGVSMVGAVFDMLFMDWHGNLSMACYILVTGFYFIPGSLKSLLDVEKETGAFIRMLVQYVLSVLTICALVIVYLYILKILILWEMPSNEIFSIISTLFCFGMPIWIMADNYRDGTRYSFILSILPYVFAPLILLQSYSMGVRILDYGMTTNRYMGVMLIILEIAVLVIWHFGKNRRENILVFLSLLIVIAIFVPGINMYSVSNKWQLHFLKQYYQAVKDGVTLSELEYDRLEGAWDYLSDQIETEEEILDYNIYEKDFAVQFEKQNKKENDLTKVETYYIHGCQLVGELDIEGYSSLNMLNQSEEYDTDWDENAYIDFSDFGFVKRATGEEIRLDISEFAEKFIAYNKENPNLTKEEISEEMRKYNRIRIDKNTVLYLNHFQLRYTEGVRDGKPVLEWENIEISGILLEK